MYSNKNYNNCDPHLPIVQGAMYWYFGSQHTTLNTYSPWYNRWPDKKQNKLVQNQIQKPDKRFLLCLGQINNAFMQYRLQVSFRAPGRWHHTSFYLMTNFQEFMNMYILENKLENTASKLPHHSCTSTLISSYYKSSSEKVSGAFASRRRVLIYFPKNMSKSSLILL